MGSFGTAVMKVNNLMVKYNYIIPRHLTYENYYFSILTLNCMKCEVIKYFVIVVVLCAKRRSYSTILGWVFIVLACTIPTFLVGFSVLAHKSCYYCIRDKNLNWITNFLGNRQQVLLNGITSSKLSVGSGIPQESFRLNLIFITYKLLTHTCKLQCYTLCRWLLVV